MRYATAPGAELRVEQTGDDDHFPDSCMHPRFARELIDIMPGARLHVIKGAGHMPGVEDPAVFTAAGRRLPSGGRTGVPLAEGECWNET